MHPYVHCRIVYNSPDMQPTYVPTDRQVGKEDVYTYTVGLPTQGTKSDRLRRRERTCRIFR